MAHFVEGAEGSTTGAAIAPQAMDINEWLKANRLSQLKDYFISLEIGLEDLVSLTETDIELR